MALEVDVPDVVERFHQTGLRVYRREIDGRVEHASAALDEAHAPCPRYLVVLFYGYSGVVWVREAHGDIP